MPDKIHKKLPKVRRFTTLKKKSSVLIFSNLYSYVKVYARKHVLHDIKTALIHFRGLDPVMDKYGKNKNTGEMLYVKLEKSH